MNKKMRGPIMNIINIYDCAIPLILLVIAFSTVLLITPKGFFIFLLPCLLKTINPPDFIKNQVKTLQERDAGAFVSYKEEAGFLSSGGIVTHGIVITNTDVIAINSRGSISLKLGDTLAIKTDRSGRWPQSKLCNARDGVCYEITS